MTLIHLQLRVTAPSQPFLRKIPAAARRVAAFAPDAPITREQFAAILYRYAQSEGHSFTGAWAFRLDFDDAVSEYAYEAMCWLTMHGLIEGDGANLHPQDSAIRAEAAAMLMRFIQTIA